MRNIILLALILFITSACEGENKDISPAQQIFESALEAHGGPLYESAHYEFVFRDKIYTIKNQGDKFEYEVRYEKNDTSFIDFMDNESFSRTANGEVLQLTDKKEMSGKEALNSVVYFATIPHKLKDKAVNKYYEGEVKIKGKTYGILKVNFDEDGGGTDHDDNYRYWVNRETKQIDFLAYDYKVNEGGVRFREGHNKRVVDGILFQDYVNYKADLGTDLDDLPKLFEEGKLKKLSDINTERVKSLRSKE